MRFKRERIIDEISIAFNNFSNVLELNFEDQKIFLDLIEYIDTYSVHEFLLGLKKIKNTIIIKYNIFLKNHKKYLESQVTDIYTEFNPKSEFKNSLKKEYYYQNSSHLDFYVKDLKNQIDKFLNSSFSIQISNNFYMKNNNLVVIFFNAKRIKTSDELKTIDEISIYTNLDNLFEEYLISQFNSNIPIKNSITDEEFEYINLNNNWLNKVENDLQFIFEEKNTRISFDKFQKKIVIISGEKHFSLNNLSSGLQAIFKIYSSLLMRTKIIKIDPDELFGIVVIDEIDVHLHISLQKKVLPFLINAFPNIQFIVSTHSPFVITSTNSDNVVYDISSGDFYEEDLSRYSYESIIKELFHVKDENENLKILSDQLLEFIAMETIPQNIDLIQDLLNEINKDFDKLTVELQLQYMIAKNKFRKLKHGEN